MSIDRLPLDCLPNERAEPLQVSIDRNGLVPCPHSHRSPTLDQDGIQLDHRHVEPLLEVGLDALELKGSGAQMGDSPRLVLFVEKRLQRARAQARSIGPFRALPRHDIDAVRNVRRRHQRPLPCFVGSQCWVVSQLEPLLPTSLDSIPERECFHSGWSNAEFEARQQRISDADVLATWLRPFDERIREFRLHDSLHDKMGR
jgi:hypothetical protein